MQKEFEELYNMGIQCLNLGNPKEALEHFTKVLSIEPDHQKSLIKKGNVLGKLGKYKEAISYYDKALEFDSDNLLALINKGLALHYLKQYKEAILFYDKVLRKKPDNTTTLYNKASSLICINKIEEGLEILEKVIKIDFSFKAKALHDIDFVAVKHLGEFKKITLIFSTIQKHHK